MAITRSKSRLKSSHYFPEELIFNILSWTKVTSLFRFKSVCKLWRSIISDNKFIESHHKNSLKNPSILLITNVGEKGNHNRCTATIVYSNSPKDLIDFHLPSPFSGMEFVSSCNGVACLHDAAGDDIYLLNLSTRMYKRLPTFPEYEETSQVLYQRRKVDLAFGVDCVSHEFKVLRMTYGLVYDYSNYTDLMAVHLYSSNANTWREIEIYDTTVPKFVWLPSCPILVHGPIIDGVLHLKGRHKIVTFDLHNEIFGQIPFRHFMQKRKLHDKSHVLDYKGSVAMIFESDGDVSIYKDISLWTVEVLSGDQVFWNKVLTFDTSLKIDWVYLFSDAKQFVGQTHSGEVFLYDYRKKETKYTGVSSENLVKVFNHKEGFLIPRFE